MLLLLIGLYTYQNNLIYPASLNDGHGYCATPDEYNMPYELINLPTEDGELLQCYLLKQDPHSPSYSNKTILILSLMLETLVMPCPLYLYFTRNLVIMCLFTVIEAMANQQEAHQKRD